MNLGRFTYYVMFGEWGECYGEYDSYLAAEEVCIKLNEKGTDAWIACEG